MIEPDIRDPATGARVHIVDDIDDAGRARPAVGSGPTLIIRPATLPTPSRGVLWDTTAFERLLAEPIVPASPRG